MRLTGNKGEWSELYAFIYLLSCGRLYAADDDVKKIEDTFFPIIKIIREDIVNDTHEYRIVSDSDVDIYVNDEKIVSIDRNILKQQAEDLYNSIKSGSNRSFSIDGIEDVMEQLKCSRIAAPSSDKTDIKMQIHDIQTGYNPICGFSIKSELGNPPTLLNASSATNFVYEITGLNEAEIKYVNEIQSRNKILDRINYILEHGEMHYCKMQSEIFASNLMMIDSRMEELVAEMLLYQYKTGVTNCDDVVNELERKNPLEFPREGFYSYKFKKLLCSVALGMMPGTSWNGNDDANGGYIIVTYNGDVLAYHIYNRDYFESYLLKNTKFERGSTSRHKYASIYESDGKYFINLNLQIRFK